MRPPGVIRSSWMTTAVRMIPGIRFSGWPKNFLPSYLGGKKDSPITTSSVERPFGSFGIWPSRVTGGPSWIAMKDTLTNPGLSLPGCRQGIMSFGQRSSNTTSPTRICRPGRRGFPAPSPCTSGCTITGWTMRRRVFSAIAQVWSGLREPPGRGIWGSSIRR